MFFSMIGFIIVVAIGVWLSGGSLYMVYYAYQISGGVHMWTDRIALCVMFLLGMVFLYLAWIYMPFAVVIL